MDIALWIASGILAAAYLAAGLIKLIRPKPQLKSMLPWTEDFAPATIKLIGAVELLGAVGLIVPWATGILPVLTPLAATGLVIVQVSAIVTHVRRGEAKVTPFNVTMLAVALFIAIGRFVQLAGV
ncbi:hypothetical protein GCM10017608_10680 [Agromyces luteolus]|uniref:DoxX family protein n=1 Tax=Agromyces luteolus TaxID=88373 RepID=A0A7C9MJE7_9MICO|nr:DoxX family protein [Agromyces luteolus]MUN08598.1 DoxX family protein [Agromyces luteolus]GLK27135.1 hypothetical protein GCM10017608_10680 [Agromyces luteolus]